MQAIEPSPRDPSRAWESAFATHYCGLCDYVLRFVGSADAAQDVVQDLFLHLWDTRGPRDAVRLTQPYLFVAARNRALKYLRHPRVAGHGQIPNVARHGAAQENAGALSRPRPSRRHARPRQLSGAVAHPGL